METLFVGQNIIRLTCVDSTNNHTSNLLSHSVMPEGTIVLTEEQLDGKGNRGRKWVSEPGKNLTLSLVLYPNFLSPSDQFRLNEMASLAVRDTVAELTSKDTFVKWPNDIYVDRSKIAGILIENSIRKQKITHSVIGIGLNINQKVFDVSIANPTSMALQKGCDHSLEQCLKVLCNKLESYYLKLKFNPRSVSKAYLDRLYLMEEWASYRILDKISEAKIVGLSGTGELLLENRKGTKTAFNFHDVEFIH